MPKTQVTSLLGLILSVKFHFLEDSKQSFSADWVNNCMGQWWTYMPVTVVPQNTTVIFSLLTLDISSLKISPSHLSSSYYLLLLPSSLLPWMFLMSRPKTGASPECCGGGQREKQIGMRQRRQDVQGGLLRVGQRSWGVPEASFIALVKLFSTLQETLIPFQFY